MFSQHYGNSSINILTDFSIFSTIAEAINIPLYTPTATKNKNRFKYDINGISLQLLRSKGILFWQKIFIAYFIIFFILLLDGTWNLSRGYYVEEVLNLLIAFLNNKYFSIDDIFLLENIEWREKCKSILRFILIKVSFNVILLVKFKGNNLHFSLGILILAITLIF